MATANLVIVGNGFDMAHGLKTSYSNFIEYLVDNKFKNREKYSDLFEFDGSLSPSLKNYQEIINASIGNPYFRVFKTENLFFTRITKKLFELNWCDIEREYFNELSRIGKDKGYESARDLNFDFEIVKNYLSEYLKNEQSKFEKIEVYEKYFSNLSSEESLILNFNYTNTVSNYIQSNNLDLIQIHGELERDDNPIIFGFAANNKECREFLQFEDKEFMRNIKKHNYKRTKEEDRLIEFLEKNERIEVSIIGHSCGLSDKLILNQIFNNSNVIEIRIYYYKNYEHYFETQVNIDRIMDNDLNFSKLINYADSLFIPQKKELEEHKEFAERFTVISETRKERDKSKFFVF